MSIFSGKSDSVGPGFHLAPLLLRMLAIAIIALMLAIVVISVTLF